MSEAHERPGIGAVLEKATHKDKCSNQRIPGVYTAKVAKEN